MEPAAAVSPEDPGADLVVRLADVVLGAVRSRSSPVDADAEPPGPGDTSIEDLRVRVSGARVDSVLVGRAGGFTITVQTGAGAPAAGTAGSSLASAARPQAPTSALAAEPAPTAAPAPAPAAAPAAAASASSAPAPASAAAAPTVTLAPTVALAPAPAPTPPAPARVQPTPAEGPSILLLRRTTPVGDVVKRTLDPSSGLVTERRFDRTGRLVAQDAVDVNRLTIVSQARDPHGRIVQLVRDASGALIQVLRDPSGRFLQAWIVPQ